VSEDFVASDAVPEESSNSRIGDLTFGNADTKDASMKMKNREEINISLQLSPDEMFVADICGIICQLQRLTPDDVDELGRESFRGRDFDQGAASVPYIKLEVRSEPKEENSNNDEKARTRRKLRKI
jgi:hypothetical protein